ncbi:MAG: hypothetical protein MUO76_04305 [Anaerolineaceae bacterium]|nr:hypothetical protein [Anaerolineaceae bacterium]
MGTEQLETLEREVENTRPLGVSQDCVTLVETNGLFAHVGESIQRVQVCHIPLPGVLVDKASNLGI